MSAGRGELGCAHGEPAIRNDGPTNGHPGPFGAKFRSEIVLISKHSQRSMGGILARTLPRRQPRQWRPERKANLPLRNHMGCELGSHGHKSRTPLAAAERLSRKL